MIYRDFWSAGYRIIGLHAIRANAIRCGCGDPLCKIVGKHPLTASWQTSPVWDEEQIAGMEMVGAFDTGYGVLCDGLLVIDIDARNGGLASFERLRHDIPDIKRAGLVVETGSGGGSRHLYFRLPAGARLSTHHADYPGIDFKSSGYVVGPGSLHASGRRYEIVHGSVDDIVDCPPDLIARLGQVHETRSHVVDSKERPSTGSMPLTDIQSMLQALDPDASYDQWVRIGMALHHEGAPFEVWDAWSSLGAKYPGPHELSKKWASFGRKAGTPVTLGTVISWAEAAGWVRPVTFIEEDDAPDLSTPEWQGRLAAAEIQSGPPHVAEEQESLPAGFLAASDDIDLMRPPGFVGEVAEWIESQSLRERRNLSVGAAIAAVGNAAGLHYTDHAGSMGTNVYVFCVAGSATGKEAISRAVFDLMKAADLSRSTYGAIKSEQEMYRNLVRHQAAFYVIDEVGKFLSKVKNSSKGSAGHYLAAIPDFFLTVWGKTMSWLSINGDMKEDIIKSIKTDINKTEAKLNEEPSKELERELERLKSSLSTIDRGIEKPFVSIIGFTTPSTFNALMDFDNATSGFVGRCLIVNERETVPDYKTGEFSVPSMPWGIEQRFKQLASGGSADPMARRIENLGPRISIPTTPQALIELSEIRNRYQDAAKGEKESTGLEAIVNRAYEMVLKVSLILAVGDGERTLDHVRWADAYVERDVREKIRLVVGNDDKDNSVEVIEAKISDIIAGDGETMRTIKKRMKSRKAEDIERVLEGMVRKGKASVEERVHKFNKSVLKYYALARRKK